MAENLGFFDSLGLNPELPLTDPRLAANRNVGAGGRAVGSALSGLLGATANKFAPGGTGTFNLGQQFQFQKDDLQARQMGLQGGGEELRSIRRIRSATAKQNFGDMRSPEARIKMAEFAASMAQKEGNAAVLAKSLTQIQGLRKEQQEWEKVQAATEASRASTDSSRALTRDRNIQDAYLNGEPVTGIATIQDGKAGLMLKDGFKPFDETFHQVAPDEDLTGIRPHEIAGRIKINKGTAIVARIHSLAASSNTALGKTERVLANLKDWTESGNVNSIISTSGNMISGADNFLRNLGGVLREFSHIGMAKDTKAGQVRVLNEDGETYRIEERTFDGKSGLLKLAQDGASWVSELIALPEGVQRDSAAAQAHRAAIMEMAYMAARLAEPSNRGLSDNDIKNALIRIAGDSSNPQVIMQRFLEMQLDAADELDFELRLIHGSLGPNVTDDQINMAMVGKGYGEYKQRKDELLARVGATADGANRVRFAPENMLDVANTPGELLDDPSTLPIRFESPDFDPSTLTTEAELDEYEKWIEENY